MNTKSIWITVIAVALSLVGGFLLANTINRSELNRLRGENEKLKTANADDGSKGTTDFSLSNEEIDAKMAEAEQNATNFQFQKNLGLALYKYASMKQNPDILIKSQTILERAYSLNKTDQEVVIGLGNAYFDLGLFNKDNASFVRARERYQLAFDQNPADVEVSTDLGLTFFLQDPPDMAAATGQFRKSLKINPKHEKTLQFIAQSLIKQGKQDEAKTFLDTLQSVNPANQSINELSAMMAQPPEK